MNTTQQHAEQQQRPGERPQVAERGAEVAAAELGDRDQAQQVAGPAPAAAERGRAADVAQLERWRRSWLERRPPRRRRRSRSPSTRCGAVDDEVEQAQLVQRDVALLAAARGVAVHEVAPRRERGSRSRRRAERACPPPPGRSRPSASVSVRLKPNTGCPCSLKTWMANTGASRSRRASSTICTPDRVALLDCCHALAARALEPGVDEPHVHVPRAARVGVARAPWSPAKLTR